MIKEGLAVTVILLFIGVAFAPSINSSAVKDDLVNIEIELLGLDKTKTIHLTPQEANGIDLLFNNLKFKLDNIESNKEYNDIIKIGIIELGNMGVINDFEMEKIQNLVFNNIDAFPYLKDNPMNKFNAKENFNCMITGETTNTNFYYEDMPIKWIFLSFILENVLEKLEMDIDDLIEKYINRPLFLLLGILIFLRVITYTLTGSHFPISTDEFIIFGSSYVNGFDFSHSPSVGWINTNGSNGIVNWEGSLRGRIGVYIPMAYTTAYIGATGFNGIKLSFREKSYYLGRAEHVSLGSYW